jgi:hypothetical protein
LEINMTSTLIAGPGEEPVALAEAKAWCRIDAADEDALVSALIAAARLQVESLTGRALVTQSWRLTTCARGLVVELPVIPVSALTAAPDGAVLEGDAVLLAAPEAGEISIDYTAGYGAAADVPQDLKQAVLALVAFWYENRDSLAATPIGFERLVARYARVRL